MDITDTFKDITDTLMDITDTFSDSYTSQPGDTFQLDIPQSETERLDTRVGDTVSIDMPIELIRNTFSPERCLDNDKETYKGVVQETVVLTGRHATLELIQQQPPKGCNNSSSKLDNGQTGSSIFVKDEIGILNVEPKLSTGVSRNVSDRTVQAREMYLKEKLETDHEELKRNIFWAKSDREEESQAISRLETAIARKLKPNFNLKFWGCLLYVCFIAFALNTYSIFDAVTGIILILNSALANIIVISFFRSRNNADKTVLNSLFVINCTLKVLMVPYGIVFAIAAHLIRKVGILTELQFLFNYRFLKSLLVAHITMYIIISIFRMLLFVSPQMFIKTNKTLVKGITILMLLVAFLGEYLISKFAYSDCKFSSTGINYDELWRNPKKSSEEMKNVEGVCRLFPSTITLSFILLILELVRLIAAIVRHLKKVKAKVEREKQKARKIMNQKKAEKTDSRTIGFKNEFRGPRRLSEPQLMSSQQQQLDTDISLKRRKSLDSSSSSGQLKLREPCWQRAPVLRVGGPPAKVAADSQASSVKEGKESWLSRHQGIPAYIKSMIMRAYSSVVFLITFSIFMNIFAPEAMFSLQDIETRTYKLLAKIDFFGTPVFWLLVEKEMNNYAKKCIKSVFLSVQGMFS